ncbi:hypothetical protein E2C01_044328 [Portunus trituberculatus]|uniref:Uncharacterized protein n=1 Tax=Portunus trituberculatus TaxID=210409 RepID=A0A5B7FZ08_PORTR|nr:hypothetical protein [Portunus trituberculatus]
MNKLVTTLGLENINNFSRKSAGRDRVGPAFGPPLMKHRFAIRFSFPSSLSSFSCPTRHFHFPATRF